EFLGYISGSISDDMGTTILKYFEVRGKPVVGHPLGLKGKKGLADPTSEGEEDTVKDADDLEEEELRDSILEMRGRGVALRVIANDLGITKSKVEWVLAKATEEDAGQ